MMKKGIPLAVLAVCALMLAGCSEKVGSDAWCKMMKEKPKADWTAKEAMDYSKFCILKK